MKPKLKPPGTKRLKLKCGILLSTSAFNFNLRRYSLVHQDDRTYHLKKMSAAGAFTRSHFSST